MRIVNCRFQCLCSQKYFHKTIFFFSSTQILDFLFFSRSGTIKSCLQMKSVEENFFCPNAKKSWQHWDHGRRDDRTPSWDKWSMRSGWLLRYTDEIMSDNLSTIKTFFRRYIFFREIHRLRFKQRWAIRWRFLSRFWHNFWNEDWKIICSICVRAWNYDDNEFLKI